MRSGTCGPGVQAGSGATRGNLAIAQLAVREHAAQAVRERLLILRRTQQGRIPGNFRDRARIGSDHRRACRECLQHGQPEALIKGRKNDGLRHLVEGIPA